MIEPTPLDPRVFRASALLSASGAMDAPDPTWPPPGCLVELTSGHHCACTSLAVAAVAAAQRTGGITAWLQPRHGLLFPPDLAQNGVDLSALVVVHVPVRDERPRRTTNHALPEAAELLLRSGAFDLLVLDLRPTAPPRGAWLARLQALAREHRSSVVVLTDERTPLTGVGLAQRIAPRRRRDGGAFVVEQHVLRDKLHAAHRPVPHSSFPHSSFPLQRSGPAGLH